MNKLTVTAFIPIRNVKYHVEILETCRIAAQTFLLMRFPEYKNISVLIETTYDEDISQITVLSHPVHYAINAELKCYLTSIIENHFNANNSIQFDLSAILYVPKTWSYSIVGDYYDKIVERIQYTFPLVEVDDIRFVYVSNVYGNIMTPIMKNTDHEIETNIKSILYAIANSVYNEVSTNDTMRKHVNSLGDL